MRLVTRLLYIAGIGALLIGGFDVSLLLRGSATPEVTTATELGASGSKHSVHLTITKFRFGDHAVLEKDDDDRCTRVWLPVLAPDGAWTPRPVVAHTKRCWDSEIERLMTQAEITGVVSNGMIGLGRKPRQVFAQSYPGADLTDAIAIELDKQFPSPIVAVPVTIGGLASLVTSLWLWRRHRSAA